MNIDKQLKINCITLQEKNFINVVRFFFLIIQFVSATVNHEFGREKAKPTN